MWVLWAAAAQAADVDGAVDVRFGVRTEPQLTVEHEHGEVEAREREEEEEDGWEPSGLVALVATGRVASGGGWAGATGEVWAYPPEEHGTVLRLAPAAGYGAGGSGTPRLDLAARYALELAPADPAVDGGRAEATASLGGAHLGLALDALHHAYFSRPTWSFGAASLGPRWQVDRGALRFELRAAGQLNAGHDARDAPVTGGQGRLRLGAGLTHGPVDLRAEAEGIVAVGGGAPAAFLPPFTSLGAYDVDIDALSAGGFTQVRAGLDLVAALGQRDAVLASAVGRLRFPTLPAADLDVAHVALGLRHDLGDHVSVSALGAVDAWRQGPTRVVDPYAWVGLGLTR
ncbi:MAG: hypothetical protein R3F59_20785 [Myxococcota bacterium]